MRSRRVVLLVLSILSCLCMGFGPPVLTDSDLPQRRLTLHQIRIMREVPAPQITAASAILLDTMTGEVLYALNEHERRAPASFVKIVTAMVALRHGRQDQEIRVKDEDLVVYSVMNLQSAEKLTLRELLFMLLIPSDNAAAMTIARAVGGDVHKFLGWMNELVASWGLQDTHFGNPHGLDNKDTYSSAYDMALIAYHAMNDPVFADIVRRPEAIVAGRRLENTNKLLNTYPGTLGVKTGTEDRAGECLVTLVERPTGRVISVVMGSEDRFADSVALLDYFYANYAELRIDLAQTPQNRYIDESNNWREFKLREPVKLLVSPWQVNAVSLYRRIDNLSANPDPAQPIGALEITLAGQRLGEVPLYVR